MISRDSNAGLSPPVVISVHMRAHAHTYTRARARARAHREPSCVHVDQIVCSHAR